MHGDAAADPPGSDGQCDDDVDVEGLFVDGHLHAFDLAHCNPGAVHVFVVMLFMPMLMRLFVMAVKVAN